MNVDFEMELATPSGSTYRRPLTLERVNRRFAPALVWLSAPGDCLLVEEPLSPHFASLAERRSVEVVSLREARKGRERFSSCTFTPWGWTARMATLGRELGAIVRHPPLETVARVNSKLWSYALGQELGAGIPGEATSRTMAELAAAVRRACPASGDKWVIKSAFGFAARDRVLGRGPEIYGPQAVWAARRFARGETLIFQPWLEVEREYGVVMTVLPEGEVHLLGISDLQTNGAGTGTGYLLGRPPAPERREALNRLAQIVGERLWREGYTGPAGIDAIESRSGLVPLLEVNARYTMGHIAVAVERELNPHTPMLWRVLV